MSAKDELLAELCRCSERMEAELYGLGREYDPARIERIRAIHEEVADLLEAHKSAAPQ
jgi:hypothetical protein